MWRGSSKQQQNYWKPKLFHSTLKTIQRNLMNVQVPFYFTDENTENTCVFHNKVKVRIEAPSWNPPHLLHKHSKSCLSSTPASKAYNAPVFLRSQIQLAAVGFWELLEKYQPFLTVKDLQTVHIFIILWKWLQCSVWKACPWVLPEQEQLHRPLCQCHGYVQGTILSLKLCFGCPDTSSEHTIRWQQWS